MRPRFALLLPILFSAPAPAQEADEVPSLVEQLGSPDWASRDAAERRLLPIGRPAFETLEAARDSADPEIARRAARLAAKIEWPAEEGVLAIRGTEEPRNCDRRPLPIRPLEIEPGTLADVRLFWLPVGRLEGEEAFGPSHGSPPGSRSSSSAGSSSPGSPRQGLDRAEDLLPLLGDPDPCARALGAGPWAISWRMTRPALSQARSSIQNPRSSRRRSARSSSSSRTPYAAVIARHLASESTPVRLAAVEALSSPDAR